MRAIRLQYWIYTQYAGASYELGVWVLCHQKQRAREATDVSAETSEEMSEPMAEETFDEMFGAISAETSTEMFDAM